jgi:hypothetical protein
MCCDWNFSTYFKKIDGCAMARSLQGRAALNSSGFGSLRRNEKLFVLQLREKHINFQIFAFSNFGTTTGGSHMCFVQ